MRESSPIPASPNPVRHDTAAASQAAASPAEQAALQSAHRLLDTSPAGAVLIDRQWRFTYANRRALEIVGMPDIIGHDIFELFPGNRQEPFFSVYHRAMDERIAGTFEAFHPAPLDLWVGVDAVPFDDGIVVYFSDITAQKTHDEIVANQLRLLADVQTESRAATWEMDPATGRIYWGPGSYPILGHPLEAVATMEQVGNFVLPGHAENIERHFAEAVRTGQQVTLESAIRAADGRVLWIEARAQAVFYPDGTHKLRGMSIDVTDRKLNEQNLKTSEERYRVLADLNPQAIWMGAADGSITYVNQGFLNYIGLTPETLTGEGWLHSFTPADQARAVEVWMDCVRTGLDYDFEGLLRRAADGAYRYWHFRAAPIRESEGAILYWLGVASDIHDAKTHAATLRAEQAETERRRAELEALYATTPVALALLDPVDFRFLNANDLEAELVGMTREQLIGTPLQTIVRDVPGVMDLMRFVAAGHVVRDHLVEGELPARPGERRAWSVNYAPIYAQDGTVRAISAASIEITNQKKAEAALIQSEKLAAVGRLASSISHEINNPLEAITNLLYLIAMDEHLPEELKIYVHMAQSELSRVSQIATQTLRFHRQAVRPTEVTARELVGAVIRLYTGRLGNSGIQVDARYDTDTQILCFENDIRQVLNNLIANAIDAMRSGGRLIIRAHEAHARTGDTTRPGVRITIADTGHGMSQQTKSRIFEPFYTTKDLQGTGLGLWISSGIVDRHQGTLSVRSTQHPQHHGTIFTLFLPCKESTQTPA